MASRRPHRPVARLWQMPLLIISIGLFGYAAYLFIDPKPGLTFDQKLQYGLDYLKQERFDAAIEEFNRLLATEKLSREQEGRLHLLLGESIDRGQQALLQRQRVSIPVNHERVIDQTALALELGIAPTGEIYRRLAENYDALEHRKEALEYYRKAIALDPQKSLRLQRRIIELLLLHDDLNPAAASLEEYLARKELTASERAWALGEKAHILIDRKNFVDARKLLAEAAALKVDEVDHGQISFWLGYCAWKLGEFDEADRQLRLARFQLHLRHPLDGEACYLLGRIAQEKNQPDQAISFYEVVLISHPDSKYALVSRLWRGVARIQQSRDDAGLTDLHDVVNSANQKAAASKDKPEILQGLKEAGVTLAKRGNYQGALEVMNYEQELDAEPNALFFARLASVYERRADQLEKDDPDARPADRVRHQQQARECRARAGDAYVAYSRALTLLDDKGYGDALWKGIGLYDRAGDIQRAIAALELFIAERPQDPQTPMALVRLGQSFQAAGAFDKAITAYQRCQFRYPQTLAAAKSAVPLAQAYIAKGPDFFGKAETVLLGLLENNVAITPDATEFRQALFELAQLYYRTNRFEEAVSRLEELVSRYPGQDRLGEVLFLMADSYRKSAALIDAAGPTTRPVRAGGSDPQAGAVDPVEAMAARKDRLTRARGLYARVIEAYLAHPPTESIPKLYQKLSHYYRADCAYELGSYEEAIKLYDEAAFRYQDDPSSLAAYVQIVNAYVALGKKEEARTANERAKWLLRRMPPEAFAEGGFAMPREYWDRWLQWTSASGLWN